MQGSQGDAPDAPGRAAVGGMTDEKTTSHEEAGRQRKRPVGGGPTGRLVAAAHREEVAGRRLVPAYEW